MRKGRQELITRAGAAVHAYQRSTQAFDDAVGRALGLNATDVRCLDWLVDGPKSAGDLSRGTGLSSAATTTLIDRLEKKGFVRRIGDASDRRRVLVAMTPKGVQRVMRFYGPLSEEGVPLLDAFSDDEIERMVAWLDAIRELTDRHRERINR